MKNNYIHYKKTQPESVARNNVYISQKEKIVTEKDNSNTEPVYLLGDRIYSSYNLKDCFPEYRMDIEGKGFMYYILGINFKMGKIIDGSLNIKEIGPRKPNFSRVRFILQIPISVELGNKESGEILRIDGYLPQIKKDIVLYIPEARSEYEYRIVADTRCELIAPPSIEDNAIELPVGVYSIISVVGRTHLLVPTYTFNPEQSEVENYTEFKEDISNEFNEKPFPEDFFPPKFVDFDL